MDHKDWIELNGLFNGIIEKLRELEDRLNKIEGIKPIEKQGPEPIKGQDVGSF